MAVTTSPLHRRLGLLLALYLAQGLPFGVYSQALPAILRSHQAPLSLISLSGLLALPWALKVLWAPLVDRHHWPWLGQRRSWILPMNAGLVLIMAALCGFDPGSLATPSGVATLFTALFLINLLAATQDIASDGLAVRILAPHERGPGNGVQVAAHRLGVIIGGGLLLVVLDSWGWQDAFLGLTLLSSCLLLPVLLFREPPTPPGVVEAAREPYARAWISFFRRPALRGWIWVLLTCKAADFMASGMVKPMLVDMGLRLADIGLQVSLVSSVTTIIGALLGGWLVERLGRRVSLTGFGLAYALTLSLYAAPAFGLGLPGVAATTLVVAVSGLAHLVEGMLMAALLAAVMDRARPELAGVDFTLQVSLLALSGGVFFLPAGLLVEQVGYGWHFLISAGLGVLLLWPAWRYTREPEALAD